MMRLHNYVYVISCLCVVILGYLSVLAYGNYSIQDASILRIEPISNVRIIASDKNDMDILASDPSRISFMRSANDTLSSSAPFGNYIDVSCQLFNQDFSIRLHLESTLISGETNIYIDGELITEQPNHFTYSSTFYYEDGGIGYASMTITPVPVDASGGNSVISINGVIVKDGETYHIEHITIHDQYIQQTKTTKQHALEQEEFIVASYVSSGDPIDPQVQSNVEKLKYHLQILDQESQRLQLLGNTTDHQLISYRLTDAQGIAGGSSGGLGGNDVPELCHELYPPGYGDDVDDDDDGDVDVDGKVLNMETLSSVDTAESNTDNATRSISTTRANSAPLGNASDNASNKEDIDDKQLLPEDTPTQPPSEDTTQNNVDIKDKPRVRRATTHQHHHHHHHHATVLNLQHARKHHHGHYNVLSHRHGGSSSSSSSRSNSNNLHAHDHLTVNPNPNPTIPMGSPFIPDIAHDGDGDTNGNPLPNTHHYHPLQHRSSHRAQPTPFERTPLLTRWSDCHPYASKGTTMVKINLLVTYGVSVHLTGSQTPTRESVIAALSSLMAKVNGPLFIQLGMKVALTNLFIMTTPDRSTTPWNYGGKNDPDSGCPESSMEVVYILQDMRKDPKSTLPPAAITHLLTTCYDTGVIGQAYVGAMRHKEFSVGWSSLRNSASWTTVLHEILHSLGASHPFSQDAETVGTYGGIMDYAKGEVEGVLLHGPYAGQVGLNVDSDYDKLCTSLQTRGFKEDPATLFDLEDSFTILTGGWQCQQGKGSSSSSNPLRSCDDISTWSTCSNQCGSGTTTRVVACLNSDGEQVSDDKCEGTRPLSQKECQDTSQCQEVIYGWKCAGRLTDLRKPSTSPNCSDDDDNPNSSSSNTSGNGTTDTTEAFRTWTTCSATCGEGKQTRYRKCGTSTDQWVDDQLCIDNLDELAPPLERVCYADQSCSYSWVCGASSVTVSTATSKNTGSCKDDAYFSSTCSTLCGTGEYKRSVFCLRSGVYLPPAECSSITSSRPVDTKTCSSTANCQYSWKCVSNRSPRNGVPILFSCSSLASSQSPAVIKDGDGNTLNDSEEWGQCSASHCNVTGTQSRQVVCLRENDEVVMTDETRCSKQTKPVLTQPCRTECPPPSTDDNSGDDATDSHDAHSGTGGDGGSKNDPDSNNSDDDDDDDEHDSTSKDHSKDDEDDDDSNDSKGGDGSSPHNITRYAWIVTNSTLCCYNNQAMITALNDILEANNKTTTTVSTLSTPDETATTADEAVPPTTSSAKSTAQGKSKKPKKVASTNKTITSEESTAALSLSTPESTIRQLIQDNLEWFTDSRIQEYQIKQSQTIQCLDTTTRVIASSTHCKTQLNNPADPNSGYISQPPSTRQCTAQLIQQCSSTDDVEQYYDSVFTPPEVNYITPGNNNNDGDGGDHDKGGGGKNTATSMYGFSSLLPHSLIFMAILCMLISLFIPFNMQFHP